MISVIGSGKWGSAIFHAIFQNHQANICPFRPKNGNFININEAKKSQFLIFALSATGTKDYLKQHFAPKTIEISKNLSQNSEIYPKIQKNPHKVLIASKGIVESEFLHDIFAEFFEKENICVLSGPSFAAEVIKDLPTAVVISGNKSLASEFANFFPQNMKTYTSEDIIGAEICGAYKNIIAIASGICDGLNLGNNARAALISRGLVEICRFGKFFGAKDETFLGLSGAGDLFLTASSTLSRNYRVGFALAKNQPLDKIIKELGEVAEGVNTTKNVCALAQKYDIYTPIASELSKVLNGKNPLDSLHDLLLR